MLLCRLIHLYCYADRFILIAMLSVVMLSASMRSIMILRVAFCVMLSVVTMSVKFLLLCSVSICADCLLNIAMLRVIIMISTFLLCQTSLC